MKHEGISQVPVDELVIAPKLAEWSRDNPYDGHPEGVIGASVLGGCARAIRYGVANEPVTNPMNEQGFHSTGIGTAVHLAIQDQLKRDDWLQKELRPGASERWGIEVPWTLSLGDEGGALSRVESDADVVEYDDETVVEVVDIKTTAPFGFMKKSSGEGPDRGHVYQVSAGAIALGAQRCRLVLISPAELKGRDRIESDAGENQFRANRYTEWTWDLETAIELFAPEMNRLQAIGRMMAEGKFVPRSIPGDMPSKARIVDPSTGAWQLWVQEDEEPPALIDTGTTWRCNYCDWQDLCVSQLKELES